MVCVGKRSTLYKSQRLTLAHRRLSGASFERIQKGGFVKERFCKMCPRSVFLYRRSGFVQIAFEPGFGAYQGLAQKIKVPFSRIFCLFLQF